VPGAQTAPAGRGAPPVQGAAPGADPHRIGFKAGPYRCELGRSVDVRQVSADRRTAVLTWQRRDYTLHAVGTDSGALRYEDRGSGLVWLMIHRKAMLLDAKEGQRLANECRI
jgi:hypothetical protein